MEMSISVSPATLCMVGAGEVMSFFWFSGLAPWGEHDSDRYFLSAILGTFGLALGLQWIMTEFWPVRRINDAMRLGVLLSIAYACLEFPHCSIAPSALFHFLVHVAHKFALVTTMCWAYVAANEYYRNKQLYSQ